MPRLRTAGGVLQSPLNLSDDHLDGDCVVSTARHYDVGVTLAGLDEFAMHRLNGGQVLLDDFIEGSPANVGVALDSSNQPDVRIGIDEYFDIAKIPHSFVDEQQNAIDDDYVRRLDACRARPAQMSDEIVLRFVDRFALAEGFKVRTEQVIVERVGMIPIELSALVQSE
jgi:hypothetical protein